MLSPASLTVFEMSLYQELFSSKLTLHSVFSRTATYPANRGFLHFTITQLEIEDKKSATETFEGSQKGPLAAASETDPKVQATYRLLLNQER